MTPMKRSRRLQAGLAGLSIVSAVGAAVGLGLTTDTGSAAPASQSGSSTKASTTGSHTSKASSANSSSTTSSSHQQSSSPVTQPTPTAPQATTSGS